MRKLLLSVLILGAFCVKAQTYTSSNFAIAGDTIFLTKDSTVISSNNYDTSGVGITWNFSNLVGRSQDQERFKAATQTGFSFAQWAYLYNSNNVNLASTDGEVIAVGSVQKTNTYNYYKISSTGLELRAESYALSVMGKSYNVKSQYSSADVLYKFPLNLNNKDSSNGAYTTSIPGVYYENVSIKRVNKVDASGTLITPYGTFSNVLRLISTVTETDTISINGTGLPKVVYNYRDLQWFVATKKYPILVVRQYLANGKWKTEEVRFMDKQQFFQPKALFGYYPLAPSVGDTVQLQNLSTNATSYSWKFDDSNSGSNNVSTLINPTHIFGSAKTYNVKLIVYNGNLKDSVIIPIVVNNGVKPVSVFTLSKSNLCAKDSIAISNASTNGSTFQWYFQGGIPSVSFDQNPPMVKYLAGGTFKVKLVVSNSNGIDSSEKTVMVTAVPTKPVKPSGETALDENPGVKLYKTSKVTGATSYNWVITPSNAGTTSSTDSTANISFAQGYTGNVYIKVMALNACGSSKYSDSLKVVVSTITALENPANVMFKMYPNPSSGLVFIENNTTKVSIALEVFDAQGRLVLSRFCGAQPIDVSLLSGVYAVKGCVEGKTFTQKLIIYSN